MKKLTAKQHQTCRMIWLFSKRHGYGPTIQQTADHFDITLISAYERIEALVRKGALRDSEHRSRAYFPSDDFIEKSLRNEEDRIVAKAWIPLTKAQWNTLVKFRSMQTEVNEALKLDPKTKKLSIRDVSKQIMNPRTKQPVTHATVFGHIKALLGKDAIEKSKKQWHTAKISDIMEKQILFVESKKKKKIKNEETKESEKELVRNSNEVSA
jgi:SOS-response transcriptional repressor LexA